VAGIGPPTVDSEPHRQTERELATGTLINQEESVLPLVGVKRCQSREQGCDTVQLAVTNFATLRGCAAGGQLIILSLG
jgi:hypothetical protein